MTDARNTETGAAGTGENGTHGGEGRLARVTGFARRHPVVTLAAAVTGAMIAGELAVAALVGGGIGMLLAPRRGAELRRDMAGRAKAAMRAFTHLGRETPPSDQTTPSPPA